MILHRLTFAIHPPQAQECSKLRGWRWRCAFLLLDCACACKPFFTDKVSKLSASRQRIYSLDCRHNIVSQWRLIRVSCHSYAAPRHARRAYGSWRGQVLNARS